MEKQKATRKEYRTPRLVAYGSVQQLTQGGRVGPPDSAVSSSHSRS